MAVTKRRTSIANPPRKRKRNGPRKMSAKQIKHFGTARQKAALKSARKRKRTVKAKAAHRPRTKSNPRRVAKRATRKSSHRKRTAGRRAVKRNVGQVVSLLLGPAMGNPGRKAKSVVRTKKRKNSSTRRHHRRATSKVRRHARRRNSPLGGGFGGDIAEVLYMIGGGVGSKLGAQMVLGSNNTGIFGYGANLAVGAVLAWGVKSLMKNAKAARDVFKGAILQVVLRAITDYTPFGSYTSQLGMGDYMASNWVTPQRYVDGLNSAQVQIPGGWAPTTVVASSGVNAAAMGAGSDGSGIY